jgi:tetratricopeptide (TPR) repeat protein
MGANILKADIALIEGDLDRAEVIYRAVAKMFPTSPSTLLKLGFLEEKRNNPQKAIEIYQTTLKLDRSSFTAIKRLATIWAKTKGIDAAVENLQTLKNESSKDQTLFNVMLGSLYTAKLAENPDSAAIARKHFEDALAEDPNMLSAYFGLARLDAISEDFEAAETRYSEIVKRQPKHIPSRMLLAISQERLSKYKEAADSYREILKVAPRFGPALNNLAWILAEELNQDLNEAQRLAEMAKEEQPIEPAVADTLGWIYHKQGNSRSAIALIEEAVQVGREHQELHPEILYHLGVVRKAVGDIEGAKSALEESLKVGGDSFNKADEIKALLGSL